MVVNISFYRRYYYFIINKYLLQFLTEKIFTERFQLRATDHAPKRSSPLVAA